MTARTVNVIALIGGAFVLAILFWAISAVLRSEHMQIWPFS